MTLTWKGPARPEPGTAPERLGALLCLSSTGHEHAFSMVYDAICARIFGVVLRVVGDCDESEEVAHEVFVEIWRRSPSFDPHQENAVEWMSGIARHRAVERIRSRVLEDSAAG